MKRICFLLLAGVAAFLCNGQSSQGNFLASISGVDRMSIVKTSIDIPSWHEKSFWPLYETYMAKMDEVSSRTYRALGNLAGTEKNVGEEEAFNNAKNLLAFRIEQQALRQQYYIEIGKDFNGVIALQFLQTEALLDMMESSDIYDHSRLRNFRFHPKALTQVQFAAAKRNTLTKALSLTPEETDNFWSVYAGYQDECDAILGENYDLIASFAGEASDFTPALAKRMGYNFLTVMERETTLKEKYFMEMNEKVGPSLAARFLAWEDYYSLVSKMHAWAENP